MYFIVQTFMLWYQYYGNRESNITQCSQKRGDCKATRIVTYSNNFCSGSEDLLLHVKIKGNF